MNDKELTHLVAPDLFLEDTRQIFDAKSGKWLGTIKNGEELIKQPVEEERKPDDKRNPNQLLLF
jgi:hypothetical protein